MNTAEINYQQRTETTIDLENILQQVNSLYHTTVQQLKSLKQSFFETQAQDPDKTPDPIPDDIPDSLPHLSDLSQPQKDPEPTTPFDVF